MKELDMVLWQGLEATIVYLYQDGEHAEIEFEDANGDQQVKTVETQELQDVACND